MYPVIIVGGGPVGLVSSILLSLNEIPHLLFERYPSTSIHPKACGLNQRTLEIFRHIGIEDEVLQHGAPPESHSRTAWYTSLGENGQEIHSRDAWGAGKYCEAFEDASPCRYVILPQIRLEPILQHRALQLNPTGIKYETEVLNIVEESDHATVSVRNKDGTQEDIKARYILGADGGRAVADWLGISWEGERDVFDMVSAYFRAPLSLHHPDPKVFISWFINPASGGSIKSGYLYHLGPYPTDPNTEEWCFGCAMLPDDPERFDKDAMIRRIKRTLDIPDLEIDVISTNHWNVSSIVAERFRSRSGNVFLVGDAAHRVPPWGALGLNTGIQDAFNLIWKLVCALRSRNGGAEQLLNSYNEERRPIALRIAHSSLSNLRSHAGAMDRALGLSIDQTPKENNAEMESVLNADHPKYQAKQLNIQKAQEVLDSEFGAHGAEVGWFYTSGYIDANSTDPYHDGQIRQDGSFENLIYYPSTIPGHHLPHIWLRRGSKTVSTRDLIQQDKLVVFTDAPQKWEELTSFGAHIRMEIINAAGEWSDWDGKLKKLCDIGEGWAVLVRPDGIIAWRGINPDNGLFSLIESFKPSQIPLYPSTL